MSLSHKVALITGAARGLGEAIAHELIHAGASVVVTDSNQEQLYLTAAALRQHPGAQVTAHPLDVRREDQARAIVENTMAERGAIDILINNAGVNVNATTETLAVEEWDRIVATNLRGAYVLSHLAFPHMKRHGGGHIVNIVSSLAKRIKVNSPAYIASKWGLLGLSQAMYLDGRPANIKVTALSPAGMRTRLVLDRFPELDEQKLLDPANVARVVRFILELPDDVAVPDLFMISTKEETWP